MNEVQCRRTLRWRAAVSRALVALLAVPVVVVSLLLMHVITSDGTASSATFASASVDLQEFHSNDEVTSADPAQPQPALRELACLIALLAGMLLLTLPLLIARQADSPFEPGCGHLTIEPRQSLRPDLNVLSISRT